MKADKMCLQKEKTGQLSLTRSRRSFRVRMQELREKKKRERETVWGSLYAHDCSRNT
jgi:hypothetical protein|tara:strand:- start:145 stop:315 length:171 start_codon:yes stop_codon:yes gene_type:complete